MEIINQYHEIAAIFIARVFLGVMFFFQGFDTVFNIKIKNAIITFQNSFSRTGMPKFLIVAGVLFTSFTELICGFLLILGLYEYLALYLLGLNLIIAAVGFGINTPMWDTKYVLPRLVLILFLLVVPAGWDHLSLDNLFFKP